MKPDWIIHYILCERPSSHTHGLDRHGSLELELNLPVIQEKAKMILNLMGLEIAEKGKIVITVQSTPTDEQTLAKIQQMIDASVERLKDSMKFQIQQEKQVEQAAPTVLNQQDLDDMLDNLTIFDQ